MTTYEGQLEMAKFRLALARQKYQNARATLGYLTSKTKGIRDTRPVTYANRQRQIARTLTDMNRARASLVRAIRFTEELLGKPNRSFSKPRVKEAA